MLRFHNSERLEYGTRTTTRPALVYKYEQRDCKWLGDLSNLLSSPDARINTRWEDDSTFPSHNELFATGITQNGHFAPQRPDLERRCFGTLVFPVSSSRKYVRRSTCFVCCCEN